MMPATATRRAARPGTYPRAATPARQPASTIATALPLAKPGRRSEWVGRTELTRRELEVLGHLADGLTTAEIAAALFLEDDTVRTHRARMYGKTGAANGAALVALAFRRGLLRPRPKPSAALVTPLPEKLAELLPLIAAGYTDEQIGRRLSLSVDGVKSRMRRLRGRLDAHTRTHVVRRAIEAGLMRWVVDERRAA